ncbi:cell surface mannoprotein Mp65p [[Candida] anglica]|uniref:Cell surface mannoprotein Mp65p n=1 Tax=[Candida] anglica TaxID=148631 RepID=A0ABP0EJG3_9ASCO
MLFKSVFTAALAGVAIAAPLQHQHHEHQDKRDVKVVTEIVQVTVGANPPAATAVAQADAVAPAPVVSSPATVATPATTAATPATPATIATGSSAPSTPVGASGAKGITYSPYSDDGGCKSTSQITKEIGALADFGIIRLYGVDCNQVSAVLAAKTSSQKVFAGIFDVANIESGIETLASAVKANGGWSEISTVSIGNELVNNGQANPSQIESYVKAGRSALSAAGYTGPVVSVDTFIAVINNPSLCQYSDYVAVNAHAFFDGGYAADQAGEWVLSQIQRVSEACGNSKTVVITETGWPSQGDSNNKAVPSLENQSAAVSSIKASCGDDAILFNAYNDVWKAPGAFNAEQYWGILN